CRRPSPAMNDVMSIASCTSPRVSSRIFPISRVMSRASVSFRSVINCAARSSISARRGAGTRRQLGYARRAASMARSASTRADFASSQANQKVVIVNGNPDMLELVETVLDAGHYDVVFVESNSHAYAEIKRVQPHLVILCLQFDQTDGFRLLTMLKLDPETRE